MIFLTETEFVSFNVNLYYSLNLDIIVGPQYNYIDNKFIAIIEANYWLTCSVLL